MGEKFGILLRHNFTVSKFSISGVLEKYFESPGNNK
jgi:hypothetical protein